MKIVIIEKDVKFFERLARLLKKGLQRVHSLHHASTVEDSVRLLNTLNPDLVFICFTLKDGDAFDVLRKIHQLDFKIFFTTGFSNDMQIVPERTAISFFLKPLDMRKIVSLNNPIPETILPDVSYPTDTKLLIPTGGSHVAIHTDEIIKCVADGNYTFFHLKDKKHLVNYPIKYYDSLLCPKGFFRINRSILVNVEHITAIHKKEAIVLTNNDKVMVSRRNRENLKRLIDHLS